jgi:hypothetical protein
MSAWNGDSDGAPTLRCPDALTSPMLSAPSTHLYGPYDTPPARVMAWPL